MSNKIIVGEKIKSIREQKQLTVEALSERSGVSEEVINFIENEKDIPALAPLIKISRGLGVRLGTFLDDSEELGPVVTRANNMPAGISLSNNSCTSQEGMNNEMGIPGAVIDTVVHYAKNAKEAGLDGVVCSVLEAKAIHEACGNDFLTVTPGIRLAGNSKDDQKRVATPEFANEQGCDMIVVGRSITKAENPVETYKQIEKEISNGRI